MMKDSPMGRNEGVEKSFAEKVIDQQIEEVLLRQAERINEGNNGIIYKVEIPVESELGQEMGLSENEGPVESVAKLLKVYRPGEGRHEFEMQQKVYDICEEARASGERIAQVPQPLMFRTLDLSEDAKASLEAMGQTYSRGKAEVIMMDLINGEDLATFILKETLRRHPDSIYSSEGIVGVDVEEMKQEVARLLNFSIPGGKSRDEGERIMEAEIVQNENAELIIKFLQRNGFVLDKRVIEIVKKTIRLIHKHRIYHRDAHPRNVMIDPETLDGDDDPQVWLIDFGTAKEVDEYASSAEIYSQDGKRCVSDEYVEEFFKPIVKTREEQDLAERMDKLSEARKFKPKIEKQPEWIQFWDQMEKSPMTFEEIYQRVKLWRCLYNDDSKIKGFILILLELSDQGQLDQESLIEFIENNINKEKRIPLRNGLEKIYKTFK